MATVTDDPWLGALIGYRSLRLTLHDADRRPDDILDAIGAGRCFAYCKVPVTAGGRTQLLARCGFDLVDTAVTFERAGPGRDAGTPALLRFVRPEDADAVAAVAGAAFRWSRFHQDPAIAPAVADRIKAAWAGNFFSGRRGTHMVVAEIDRRVAGFLQLIRADGALVIDLIGLADAARGAGIGTAMIAFAERRIEAWETLRVGTQLANMRAVRFYEGLGMRMVDAAHNMHWHQGRETP